MIAALDRRGFVAASLAQAMVFALGGNAHGQAGAGHDGLVLGQAQPFSFDALKAWAKAWRGLPIAIALATLSSCIQTEEEVAHELAA